LGLIPHACSAAAAAAADQRVIVACHHPLAPGSAPEQYLAWNYQELLALLEQHAGTLSIKAFYDTLF
jgi:hypothetical protein